MSKTPPGDFPKLYSAAGEVGHECAAASGGSGDDLTESTTVVPSGTNAAASTLHLRIASTSDWASLDRRQQRELDRLAGVSEAKTVTVSLEKIVPLLVEASENNRGWIQDFAKDTVRIDADLYEVLLAYQQLQHRSA